MIRRVNFFTFSYFSCDFYVRLQLAFPFLVSDPLHSNRTELGPCSGSPGRAGFLLLDEFPHVTLTTKENVNAIQYSHTMRKYI